MGWGLPAIRAETDHVSVGPWGQPAFLADSVPWSEGPLVRQALQAGSVLGQKNCGVDQISRPTQSRDRADAGSTSCPCRLGPGSELTWCRPVVQAHSDPDLRVQAGLGSTSCPDDSAPVPRRRGVDQLSRPTQSRVRADAWSTSCPGHLRTVSE